MKEKSFANILKNITNNSLIQSERDLKDEIIAREKYQKFKDSMIKNALAGRYYFTTDNFEFKHYPYFCMWAGQDDLLIVTTEIEGIEYLTFAWGEY